MRILVHGVSLFFGSKVTEAARHTRADVVFCQASSPLAREVERTRPAMVILELEKADLAQLAELKARKDLPGVKVVGFASHVNEAVLESARQAGCDEVYSKGEFTRRLEDLLSDD